MQGWVLSTTGYYQHFVYYQHPIIVQYYRMFICCGPIITINARPITKVR